MCLIYRKYKKICCAIDRILRTHTGTVNASLFPLKNGFSIETLHDAVEHPDLICDNQGKLKLILSCQATGLHLQQSR